MKTNDSNKKNIDVLKLSERIDAIIQELMLPQKFPREVTKAVRKIDEDISSKTIQSRKDLRKLTTVTIDGDNARDYDDAISVERVNKGILRLYVSIADVSYYVESGSIIDKEAFARGTSVYFPSRVLPMLPERLSNNLCSLVPHKDRLTVTAVMEFDRQGKRTDSRFFRSIICSNQRLTYRLVADALIEEKPEALKMLGKVLPDLKLMYELFGRLRMYRLKRGSLDFDLPEPEIIMDMEETQIDNIVKVRRTQAHMMIEEFMIAANEAVAEFITEQEVPSVYRIHETPKQEKLKDLQKTLHNLGYALKVPHKKMTPLPLAAVVKKAEGTRESRMINTLLLRSLEKAIYSVDNKGHFGLASQCYTHFTSPIRRYPDLIIHRILTTLIEKKKNKKNTLPDLRRLTWMAEHCSICERSAMQAEWAMRDLLVTDFMKQHVGKQFDGIISGVTKFGLFVELSQYFVEGLVHMRHLKDDYYHFIESDHSLRGKRTKKRYRIGDALKILVKGVDLEKRWVDFVLA
jgi:ribonuclease R